MQWILLLNTLLFFEYSQLRRLTVVTPIILCHNEVTSFMNDQFFFIRKHFQEVSMKQTFMLKRSSKIKNNLVCYENVRAIGRDVTLL